jgi:hypothetical protein
MVMGANVELDARWRSADCYVDRCHRKIAKEMSAPV